jgi:hypothetical protein
MKNNMAIRDDIDPWRQIADWRSAISFLEARSEVDPLRIGLWGTSYACSHAIVLGATDRRSSATKWFRVHLFDVGARLW